MIDVIARSVATKQSVIPMPSAPRCTKLPGGVRGQNPLNLQLSFRTWYGIQK